MKRLRVTVLDDSAICRAQLRSFLEAERDIEVVGEAANGDAVLPLLEKTRPQVLVVDLQMPRTNGHQTIETVMANAPLPILVVTSQPLGPEREVVFESIRKGALDLAEKPSLFDRDAQARLRHTVRRLATVPVVRHVAGKLGAPTPPLPHSSRMPPAHRGVPVVGIGSSAGGPVVLGSILSSWSCEFPAAILVVQHLPTSFTPGFIQFLENRTQLKVRGVEARTTLEPGYVYLPLGEVHLGMLGNDSVGPLPGPARSGHLPAVDVLFETMAEHAPTRSLGIILSGIGRDGADQLLQLRRRGGTCVVQDEATSAVWGMPRAALENGAAQKALAPVEIAKFGVDWALARSHLC